VPIRVPADRCSSALVQQHLTKGVRPHAERRSKTGYRTSKGQRKRRAEEAVGDTDRDGKGARPHTFVVHAAGDERSERGSGTPGSDGTGRGALRACEAGPRNHHPRPNPGETGPQFARRGPAILRRHRKGPLCGGYRKPRSAEGAATCVTGCRSTVEATGDPTRT
jgi:hypothetical protein